jgi:hypothetical protein
MDIATGDKKELIMPKFQVLIVNDVQDEVIKDLDNLMGLRVFLENEAYTALHHGDITSLVITRIDDATVPPIVPGEDQHDPWGREPEQSIHMRF